MEDVIIGRHTVDTTRSNRQEVPDSTDPIVTVIAANQYRVGLRLYGDVTAIVDDEAESFFENGAVEVWVDEPPALGTLDSGFNTLLLVLTQHMPSVLLRVETEGRLLQRRIVMRPVRPVRPGVLSSFFCTTSYTEYMMPEGTEYINRAIGDAKRVK